MIKLVTGICRLSYEHLWTPKSIVPGQEPKYSCTILVPKDDAVTTGAIKAAINSETFAAWPNGKPQGFKNPLKDGDGMLDAKGKQRPETVGCYVISASSKQQPGIVDAQRQTIVDKNIIYSGCFCRFALAFASYNQPTFKGIGCYLNHVQFVKDGPSLAGRSSPEDAFNDNFVPPIVKDDDC